MKHSHSTVDDTEDLFGPKPILRSEIAVPDLPPPELAAARSLCRQLRRTAVVKDKQRIAHLICLNLMQMLRHG